jgi:hypothetical protein
MVVPARSIAAAMGVVVLAACVTTQPRMAAKPVQVYSDDGLSELTAPDTWVTRPNLTKSGTIRLGDDDSIAYLVVNTYLPHELKGEAFPQFAEKVSKRLMSSMRGTKISAARPVTVQGRPALEYEISGTRGALSLVYLSTVVDGEKARHHLVAWTPVERDRANRDALREAVASFRESAQKRAAKPRIDLTFDWPERMTSSASVRSRSAKRGEVLEMSIRTISTVRPLGDDELLVSGKVTEKRFGPASKDKGKADYLERLLAEATADMPDYVVDRDGDFVRMENLGPYVKRVEDALVNGLPKGTEDVRAKARQMARQLVNEETLNALVQDEWNSIVGNWAEASFVPGHVYERQATYWSPALGEQTFPMQMTQRLVGRVACTKGAAPDSCVRLVQTSRVSDPSFTRASSVFVRKAVGAEVSVDSAEVLKSVEVIADPDTLLPYRSVVKETKTFTVSAKGSAPKTTEETSERVTIYSY